MERFRNWPALGRSLLAIAVSVSALGLGAAAQAADGYWRFTGYTVTPSQTELDASDRLERGRGRTSERRVTGAYQAAESGAGTVDLFFKNDDVDRRIYLTTMTFNFTSGAEMRWLRAGQTLHLNSTLSLGGNDLARALPAGATGSVWVNNGDYIVNLAGAINQPSSGSGNFVVPRGSGNGDSLTIKVKGHIGANGGLSGQLDANYVWVPGAAPGPAIAPTPPPRPSGGSGNPRQWMTGTFSTSEGTLYLSPSGGTYTQDNGRIRVISIVGARMEGYWEETSSDRQCSDGRYYGRVRWTFTPSGFSGTWGYCDDEPSRGSWSGTRQ